MQISLSKYADHRVKYYGIYSKMSSSDKTIVKYYCSIAKVDENKTLYLYISSKTVLEKEEDNAAGLFKLANTETRATTGHTRECLCGALHSSNISQNTQAEL